MMTKQIEQEILAVLPYWFGVSGLQVAAAITATRRTVNPKARAVGVGSLYPVLHELERGGFVESRWDEDVTEDRDGARRRLYRKTSGGSKRLNELDSAPVNGLFGALAT